MTDSLTALRLISFPGTGNLPLFAGTEKGFFKAQGVEIDLETTPSSMYQAQKLVAGEFDLACTAVDNVFAYQEGAGEIELDRDPDLFIAMGATQIELCFVVAPDIETFADLKGKTIAMDALATGFAFVLYQMLENAGLSGDDVTLVSVGSTPSRWEAVRDGKHAGTLLIEPFTSAALLDSEGRVMLVSGASTPDLSVPFAPKPYRYREVVDAIKEGRQRGLLRVNPARSVRVAWQHLGLLEWTLVVEAPVEN